MKQQQKRSEPHVGPRLFDPLNPRSTRTTSRIYGLTSAAPKQSAASILEEHGVQRRMKREKEISRIEAEREWQRICKESNKS